MTGRRGPAASWAHGLVVDWTLHLVRGLPREVADDRFEEIVSDLWEQERSALQRGSGDLALAASLLARLVAGIPADVRWRAEARDRSLATAPRPITPAPVRRLADLAPERPFDQTNGTTAFDGGPLHDASDAERDLIDKGVRINVGLGFFGGGGGIG
ncbi:hypothetical protein [Amnibacterium endophyticum]|uniref:DUF2267 domain-containing protein n=1 Tax=Amnibacterium endophyticum TaxID=2109337 RepID=A0ABW4LFE0_9MICO